MSNEAVQWAMDDAPMLQTEKGKPDTTARHVLQVLAEHARPDGSNAHPSVTRIQYRTGYDRVTVQRALRRLEKGGLIARSGTVSGRSCWRLLLGLRRPETDWKAVEREEESLRAAAAERQRRSRANRAARKAPAVTHAESVTDGGVTHSECVSHELSVRDVTHFKSARHALNAALTTNEPPEQPPTTKDISSSAPPKEEKDEDDAAQQPPTHLQAFGAFWLVYPRKKNYEDAKKAWIAAIERGIDPQLMVERATAYANERAGQPAQYTKYPATWLDKGSYADEPDPVPTSPPKLRAVAGGYEGPWRNPTDQSEYDKGIWDE